MLKRFEVSNYKVFKDKLVLDFSRTCGYKFNLDCVKSDILSKIIVYGLNATGKTNLGRALMDIYCTNVAMINPRIAELNQYAQILNADNDSAVAYFKYEFKFDEDTVEYCYKKRSLYDLEQEMLSVNGQKVFEIEYAKKMFNVLNLQLIGVDGLQTELYLEELSEEGMNFFPEERNMSFLRFIFNNAVLPQSSVIFKLRSFASKMVADINNFRNISFKNQGFVEYLVNSDKLRDFEVFLNEMGVECKLCVKKAPDGDAILYFKHDKLVPFFENASSGTLRLANMYRRFFLGVKKAAFIFLDEFDAFFHYEMSEKVVLYLRKYYPDTQVIMTTHNTNLMNNHIMRPDCLFILSRSGQLTPLCDATERELREGHNLEKMYIAGEFERYE